MFQWFQTQQGKQALFLILLSLCLAGLFLLYPKNRPPAAANHPITAKALRAQLKNELKAELQPPAVTGTAPVKTLEDIALTAPQTVARFYEQRQWQPLWDDARYTSLLAEIRNLANDGLNPDDYFLTALERCLDARSACAQSTEREVLATNAYLLALAHLNHGKVNPALIEPGWNFDMPQTDAEQELQQAREAAEQQQIATAFQRARPGRARYEHMRTALARLRELAAQGGWQSLPLTTQGIQSLKPGMTDERVILLRQRLQLAGLLAANTEAATATATGDVQTTLATEKVSETTATGNTGTPPDTAATQGPAYFDTTLENAVKHYQKAAYLVADGVVGKQTLEHLNVPIEQRINQLRVNLERMRWHLRDIPGDYIIVDVAGYSIAYVREGKVIWQSRVQVGKSSRKTPILQSRITHLTFNPQWTIPPTILRKDTLPEIRKDHSYLAKNHIRVLNAQGQELSAETIDWNHPGNITLRQDAGVNAALGQLAIRFPNDHSVYLHETPHQSHFSDEQRNFSSGCIRVENVRDLAILLFNDNEKWNRETLELALANLKTREVLLQKKIPILIDYWTVDIDETGYISYRPDAYGKDDAVLKALDTAIP